MTELEFRALLTLVMCCDPWPVDERIARDLGNQDTILNLLNKEARKRGFDNWVEAYHQEIK